MRRLILAALCLAVAARAHGQPLPGSPEIGQLFARSPHDLAAIAANPGCALTFNREQHTFGCVDVRLISISRAADGFNLATGNPPTLSCGVPCVLLFPDTGDTTASLDWIMPSEPLVGSSLLLTWRAAAADGTAVWDMDSCTYQAGQAPCTPGIDTLQVVSSDAGIGLRTDAVVNPFSPSWAPNAHVVLNVTRRKTNPADTLVGNALVEGLRLELSQP